MPLWVTWILLPLIVWAQSGDVDVMPKEEIRLFCTSHISAHTANSLTCNLMERRLYIEDDEDEEDSIESITVCSLLPPGWVETCQKETGNNITITRIPYSFNVTFELRRGGVFSRIVDMRKIVKPKSPCVRSAAFHPQNNQAVINIETPYHRDFLTASNQLFQFHIWSTADNTLTENVTGIESLIIAGEYLTEHTTYHVKVRAIPSGTFEGTWSDWSNPVEFYTDSTRKERGERSAESLIPMFVVILGILVMSVICSIFVMRKNIHQSIRTYTRPRIPTTLSPIYKQVKLGFAMTFEPEQFSHMNIQPMKKIKERPSESQAMSTDPTAQREDSDFGLDQELSTSGMRRRSTSDTSTFTGGSASTLLSGSSEEATYSRPNNRSPSPSMVLHAAEGGQNLPESSDDSQRDPSPEVNGPMQPSRDAVYVTMSSFYHSNDQRNQ
ncbi:unnamed protein product [Lota lota]